MWIENGRKYYPHHHDYNHHSYRHHVCSYGWCFDCGKYVYWREYNQGYERPILDNGAIYKSHSH